MTTISEEFLGNLIADATYVDFDLPPDGSPLGGNSLRDALFGDTNHDGISEGGRFTLVQATQFSRMFEVVAKKTAV